MIPSNGSDGLGGNKNRLKAQGARHKEETCYLSTFRSEATADDGKPLTLNLAP